jgi:hypothetical protein
MRNHARLGLRGLACLLFTCLLVSAGLPGCSETVVRDDVTGVEITVTYDARLGLDQLEIAAISEGALIGEPVRIPESAGALDADGEESLVILFSPALAGDVVLVRVHGLAGGQVVASGSVDTTLELNKVIPLTMHLVDPAACGDGVLQAHYEECDDGRTDDGDGCSALCLVEEGWTCDLGSPSSCARCGDGECGGGEDLCNCPGDCATATCGDGNCCDRGGENGCSCPEDCGAGTCGDSVCCLYAGESTCTCQQDCGQETCGNGTCCQDTGETAAGCPADCATGCGDDACLAGEDKCTCPDDCGDGSCGDDICCAVTGEDTCTCPDDCGMGTCSDGLCCATQGENPCTCPGDCTDEPCGDGICCTSSGEDICTCPDDCNGPTTCGDTFCCPPGEDAGNCPEDCVAVCPDGRCTSGEDECNCIDDCAGQATCGDGSCCAPLEDPCSCPLDCGDNECGDTFCCPGDGENRCTCDLDCGDSLCGDSICCQAAGENRCTCEADCGGGNCGDEICCPATGEDVCTCPGDCPGGTCGDELCCADADEDRCSCPEDCGDRFCGDGICCEATGEDVCSCNLDCGQPSCNDGVCCPGLEDKCSCPPDCGEGECGDGICCEETGEDPDTCPQDCAAVCPDQNCSASEDRCSCPEDCGAGSCPDEICCEATGEDVCTCPEDCPGGLCGDTICCLDAGEDPCTCPQDCGEPACPDTFCCPKEGEDTCTCPDDCGTGTCPDGICCPGEGEDACTCPDDCPGGICGDTICCAATGEDENNCPEDCGTGCPHTALGFWLATNGDVSGSGVPGLDAWASGDALLLGQPDLAMEPDVTAGNLSVAFSLDGLATDGDATIDGIHRVSRDLTLTTTPPFDLLAGDLLLSTADAETLGGVEVAPGDVILFRPDIQGDYGAGSFEVLLDGDVVTTNDMESLSLVEQETVLADVTLPAGTLIFSMAGNNETKYLWKFVPAATGEGTTAGDRSTLIRYEGVGLPNKMAADAVELLETCAVIGDESLPAGRLLLSMPQSTWPDGAGGEVHPADVFYLTLTATDAGSGYTAGTATLLLEGADLGLDSDEENTSALSLR